MNVRARIDAVRMLRIATVACALAAAALIVLAYQPHFDALRGELADSELQLRSDEISLSAVSSLGRRRRELAERYAAAFGGDAQAQFLTEVARTLREHHVALASAASVEANPAQEDGTYRSAFARTRLTLELRGTYRELIAVIGELSLGAELVRVAAPSFHRAGSDLAAVVPITLYEPARPATPPPPEGNMLP